MEFPFDPLTKFPRPSSEMSRLVTYFLQRLNHSISKATFENSGTWVRYASAAFVSLSFWFTFLRSLMTGSSGYGEVATVLDDVILRWRGLPSSWSSGDPLNAAWSRGHARRGPLVSQAGAASGLTSLQRRSPPGSEVRTWGVYWGRFSLVCLEL